MSQFLLRLIIAITLLTVEVVLATAFVANFTRPVESLKIWFQKHYRVTLSVVLPVLLATNVGLTFLFSEASPGESTEAAVQEQNTDYGGSDLLESIRETEVQAEGGNPTGEPLSPAPIQGHAADRTMSDGAVDGNNAEAGNQTDVDAGTTSDGDYPFTLPAISPRTK